MMPGTPTTPPSLPDEPVSKYQRFLGEIVTLEEEIRNDRDKHVILKPAASRLYEPLHTLWDSYGGNGSEETISLFQQEVAASVDDSHHTANQFVREYEQAVARQPERRAALLTEHRDFYVGKLADTYVPIDPWYHDFWDEQESRLDAEELEKAVFLFCYKLNKPFMLGLRLVKILYSYYFAIGQFNTMLSSVNKLEVPPTGFELYLSEERFPNLMPYLIATYTGKKARFIVPMLYALEKLGVLSYALLHGNQTQLHNALVTSFGQIGTRTALNDSLLKFQETKADETKKVEIERHRQQISMVLQRPAG